MQKTLKIIQECERRAPGQECAWPELLILAHEVMLFCVYLAFTFGVISIAYAGWLMLSSGGSSSEISKAKGIFSKVIWGLVITICAYLFVQTILKLIGLDESYSLLVK